MQRRALFVALLACTACGRSSRAPSGSARASDASGEASPKSAPPVESVASARPTAHDTPPETTKTAPNLLAVVPSRVAVSSTVVNPRDFPEHLIDGKADTAWNSKTGDLHGWIAFRVPTDAKVDAIQLTSGFDKKKGDVDLFTANHRITKIAVSRDGQKLKEASLDPTKRGLQSIAIDGPGGDYRIDVLDTLPGSRKDWKELTVSEFKVVGHPGKERRRGDEALRVAMGSLDERPLPMEWEEPEQESSVPQATIAALCVSFVKTWDGAPVSEMYEGLKRDKPSCVEEAPAPAFTPAAPYKSVHVVRLDNGLGHGKGLVVETARGFWLPPIQWATRDDPTDPGCPSVVRPETIEEIHVENGYLVVIYGGTRTTYVDTPLGPEDPGNRELLVRSVYWGKEDAKGVLSFRHWNAQYQEAFGTKTQPHWAKKVDYRSLPWSDLRNFYVDPTGAIRLQQ